jgi:hypothetical protein
VSAVIIGVQVERFAIFRDGAVPIALGGQSVSQIGMREVAIGIQPQRRDFSERMSGAVSASVEALVGVLKAAFAGREVAAQAKSANPCRKAGT